MASNREQISVPLPAELRAYVQQVAVQEDRSVASVVRRCVEAARQSDSRSASAA